MSAVALDAILATCGDERHPPSAALDGRANTYFITTGLFPQELVFAVKAGSANVSKLSFITFGIQKLRVEKSFESTPSKFVPLLDCEMDPPANYSTTTSGPVSPGRGEVTRQVEQFQLNKTTAGANVRFLKVVIESGYGDFAAMYDVSVEGDEVEED
eukprot:GFYU01032661.1.p2 GENE.GFYU01032661.1~~GFYU01032661.1.p2  ORF type:complete len:157 (+),score=36.52 GFYU01032661.1:36-506(+)